MLSKGKVLTKVLELRAELLVYLQEDKSEYSKFICDPENLIKLAILSDLFEHLNTLNKSGMRISLTLRKQNNFNSFSWTRSYIGEVGFEIIIMYRYLAWKLFFRV